MPVHKIKLLAVEIAAEHARLYNMLDETAYRNNLILLEFERLKKDCPGEIVESLILQLAEKKWNGVISSCKQLEKICYPYGEEKEKARQVITLAMENPILDVQHQTPNVKHPASKRRTYARRR